MKKVHFVEMWIGQTCVGMIHKFVPIEIQGSVFKKNGSGEGEDFSEQLANLQETPQIPEKIDEAAAKARELKKMFAKKSR